MSKCASRYRSVKGPPTLLPESLTERDTKQLQNNFTKEAVESYLVFFFFFLWNHFVSVFGHFYLFVVILDFLLGVVSFKKK